MQRRLASVLLPLAVFAAACGDDDTEMADEPPPPAVSPTADSLAGDDLDSAPRPQVERAEAGEFRGATGADGTHLPVLDPSVQALPFEVEQIASTAREDVPSALRGDRTDPSFPEPLIPLDRIVSGGPPPDGIPPIDTPKFQYAASLGWMSAVEPVVVLEINDDVRAYPVQLLAWHEIVNDTVGGVPVTVAYCPLCNSALAYDRRLGDRILDFGTSGELFNSSLVMYDRQTESLWTHFDSRAVVGHLAGQELTTYSVQMTSWEQFRDANPDAIVLSRSTGFDRQYGRNPYLGYDNPDGPAYFFDGEVDPRLREKERVVVVRDPSGPAVVVPLEPIFDAGAFEFAAHGRDLVAIVDPGVSSPLDGEYVDFGYDQGAAAVYVNELDGRELELVRTDDGFTDVVSGLTFDVFGVATDGSGVRLEPVEHLDTFWFAIAAFEPEAQIIDG
ncbi:MAG: DUF3179 domain-containing protein [Actinomycetota bacterium]